MSTVASAFYLKFSKFVRLHKPERFALGTLARISAELKIKGKLQKDLTGFLGLKEEAFSDWKAGRSSSYLKYLPQIAKFLGVSIDYLAGQDITEVIQPTNHTMPDKDNTQENALSPLQKLVLVSVYKQHREGWPCILDIEGSKEYFVTVDTLVDKGLLHRLSAETKLLLRLTDSGYAVMRNWEKANPKNLRDCEQFLSGVIRYPVL
jgi:transcriptional regulator with XRE-family HTH domain